MFIKLLILLCVVLFSSAPRPPTSVSFGGVTNTSLELTWSGPAGSDYDDFDLQWEPRDHLSVFNPYHTRTSGSRILKGLYPGRLYNFSLRTVSGAVGGVGEDGSPAYSLPIHKSIRTSRWRCTVHCLVASIARLRRCRVVAWLEQNPVRTTDTDKTRCQMFRRWN